MGNNVTRSQEEIDEEIEKIIKAMYETKKTNLKTRIGLFRNCQELFTKLQINKIEIAASCNDASRRLEAEEERKKAQNLLRMIITEGIIYELFTDDELIEAGFDKDKIGTIRFLYPYAGDKTDDELIKSWLGNKTDAEGLALCEEMIRLIKPYDKSIKN